MDNKILGLHHITAITSSAQRNYDFYTGILGLRLVKRTVNFDDPGTYHFYYGNEDGTPGTILTFFAWEHLGKGNIGPGMATEIGYSVPEGSMNFWIDRFKTRGVEFGEIIERFGEKTLTFKDPDGLLLSLIIPKQPDARNPWTTGDVSNSVAPRGFHSVSLMVRKVDGTAKVLTDIFGYRLLSQESNRYRFVTDAIPEASIVDIIEDSIRPLGHNASGTNHHVAFRVPDENIQMAFREKVVSSGLQITPKIDRDYFFSLYFREPGGVLFEIATDNPGFTVDEPKEELGSHLKLPQQYESARDRIERVLPKLNTSK